ncbi:MAG TPA: hypothetical protein V6C78_34475 [Crinalium sp.]|jgi:hypothetical protein
MVWLLNFLEFLEFLTTPLGIAVSVWGGFYYFALQSLNLSVTLAMLLPAILAVDLYFVLHQSE